MPRHCMAQKRIDRFRGVTPNVRTEYGWLVCSLAPKHFGAHYDRDAEVAWSSISRDPHQLIFAKPDWADVSAVSGEYALDGAHPFAMDLIAISATRTYLVHPYRDVWILKVWEHGPLSDEPGAEEAKRTIIHETYQTQDEAIRVANAYHQLGDDFRFKCAEVEALGFTTKE